MPKIVFITGASSGIGAATARKFASEGYRLILNARRQERLEKLADELEREFSAESMLLPFDVQDQEAVFTAIAAIPENWKEIDLLINNAGLALGRDSFENADLDDWNTMIDTNVKGLLYVSRAVLPYMIARGKGHIINIGSTAGKEVYQNGNVYCATKHAVGAISEAMRIDLLPKHIKVTALHPGAVDTEFSVVRFKGDKEKAATVYAGYVPLYAENLAEIAFYCASLPPSVCINDLVVTATAQANSFYLHKDN